jgi:hypothetical protein
MEKTIRTTTAVDVEGSKYATREMATITLSI